MLYSWLKKNVGKYDYVIENMMQFPLFTPEYIDKSKLFFIKHHFLGNNGLNIYLIEEPGLGCLFVGLTSEISLALYFDLVVG